LRTRKKIRGHVPKAAPFFRSGKAGGWKTIFSKAQVKNICKYY